ncbi:MAG: glycosyltransferase family 39 protein [Chloroflexi bacterium]|nr:glycosyltransferase family 39 protein [Chloroflexota bacterium]
MSTGTALWLVVVSLGAALRLGGLDLLPLNDDEARVALAALHMARGETGGGEEPLAVALGALVFFLAGDSDAAVRLSGGLIGTVLVALPWLWRRELGRGAMLLASFLMAISPTLVHGSRLVSAESAVPVLALLAVRVASGAEAERGPRMLLGALAGLLLLAGASGWAVVLLLGTTVVLSLRGWRDRLRRALEACGDPACWLSAGAVSWVLGGLLTGSLAPWLGGVRRWVALWEWPERGETPLAALGLVLAYEPLVLGLSIVAGLTGSRSGSVTAGLWPRVFGWWALAGSFLWLSTAGAERGLFSLALLPGLLWLAPRLVEAGETVALLGRWLPRTRASPAGGAWGLAGPWPLPSLPRLAVAAVAAVLLAVQAHTLSALNFAPDSPELWPAARTDVGTRRTLEELERDLRRPPKGSVGLVDGPGPAVAWYLRRATAPASSLPVLALVGGGGPTGAVAYAKIGIAQRQVWKSDGFDLALAWRWLVRRAAPGLREGIDVPIYLLEG